MRALALALIVAASPAAAMQAFDINSGVVLQGRIESGDEAAILPKLRGVVELNSPGGSVAAALAIAETVRKRGLTTYVPPEGRCYSACTLIWFAGARRIAHSTSYIGIHRASAETEAFADVVSRALAARLLAWGTPRAIVDAMLATPNSSLRAVRADELPADVELRP